MTGTDEMSTSTLSLLGDLDQFADTIEADLAQILAGDLSVLCQPTYASSYLHGVSLGKAACLIQLRETLASMRTVIGFGAPRFFGSFDPFGPDGHVHVSDMTLKSLARNTGPRSPTGIFLGETSAAAGYRSGTSVVYDGAADIISRYIANDDRVFAAYSRFASDSSFLGVFRTNSAMRLHRALEAAGVTIPEPATEKSENQS